jgi:uncharacterized membrane protein HdeD (DUF308 family)
MGTNTAKSWYLFLVFGILFILMGIWVLVTPVSSFIALSIFFALTFLVVGILEIIYAISNGKAIDHWGWNLAGGILDLILGVILVSHPHLSMIFLIFYIGFALFFRSVMTIGSAIHLNKQDIRNWGWVLVIGILGLIFSFLLLWNPALTGLAIVIYLGVAFIFIGISQLILSFRLKQWKNQNKNAE